MSDFDVGPGETIVISSQQVLHPLNHPPKHTPSLCKFLHVTVLKCMKTEMQTIRCYKQAPSTLWVSVSSPMKWVGQSHSDEYWSRGVFGNLLVLPWSLFLLSLSCTSFSVSLGGSSFIHLIAVPSPLSENLLLSCSEQCHSPRDNLNRRGQGHAMEEAVKI